MYLVHSPRSAILEEAPPDDNSLVYDCLLIEVVMKRKMTQQKIPNMAAYSPEIAGKNMSIG